MNGDVKIKTKDGDIFFLPYADLTIPERVIKKVVA